jgi:hypothetical protein
VHGHHTDQLAARGSQRVGILPAGHRLRAQCRQAGNFCRQVVRLNVEVVARRVIDRLDDGELTFDVPCGAGLRGRMATKKDRYEDLMARHEALGDERSPMAITGSAVTPCGRS